MKRRQFMLTATGAAMTPGAWRAADAQTAHRRDVSYEPDRPLESTGLRIRDGVRLLEDNEKGNIRPELREEISENPGAVFIIRADVKTSRNADGAWKPVPDQMERLGGRVAGLVFRKGTDRKGCTFIKPNLVGGLNAGRTVDQCHGGIVHPHFVVGMTDRLRDLGNTNLAIGARGALRHEHVVASGFKDLLDSHNLPMIEAHLQYFRDYDRSELEWHRNRRGMVQRKFPTYKPAYSKNTSFVNIAHAHVHKVGHTTLTLKNLQGVMPRGYGHICDAWTSMDMWRAHLMKDFNRDYREDIQKSYVKHANMGYKNWDPGGFHRSYLAAGGWEAFEDSLKKYRKSRGDERDRHLERCMDIADTRLFWAEIWAQRMMDIVEALPPPMVSIVEGTFARGADGIVNANFVTVGKSMVAVDAVTTWIMGHDPREVPYLRIAKERGLGENDIDRIPLFILDERGVHRVNDVSSIERQRLAINNFGGIRDHDPVIFGA